MTHEHDISTSGMVLVLGYATSTHNNVHDRKFTISF